MAVEVGQEAPDFTLKYPDDENATLSSLRGRKNVVLSSLRSRSAATARRS